MLAATIVTLATLDPSGGEAAAHVAIDAKGDLFGARGPTETDNNETIFEIPAGSSTPVTLASFGGAGGLTEVPDSIGIDSAGDLFVTDTSSGFNSLLGEFDGLWELPAGSATVKDLGAYRDTALDTVDAAGNAFLYGYAQATDANPSLFRYSPSTDTTTTVFTSSAGAENVIAVDASGTVFDTLADPSGSGATDVYRRQVKGASVKIGQIAAADGTVIGLATNARGGLFATTSGGDILKLTASGRFSQVGSLGGTTAGGFIETPVADAAGDLFSLAANGASYTLVELAAGSNAVTVLGSTPATDTILDQSAQPLAISSAGDVYWSAFDDNTTVTLLRVGDASPANLSVTTGKTTVPATVVAGTKMKGAVAVRLDNTGRTALKGTETVQLYADTAGQAGADGTLVGTAKHGTVAGGGSATVPVKVKPVVLPSGSYTLTAVVTNATGVVVATVPGPAVTVVPATVILSATVTRVSTTATAPGKSLSFTLTVTNDGNAATTGTASVAVFLSADGSQDTVAVARVRGLPKSPKVAAGKSASYRVTIVVPADAPAMKLYPLVRFEQDAQMATAVAKTDVTVD